MPDTAPHIVMGIDPGLGATGWAVVARHGDQSQLIAFGALRTKPRDPLSARLHAICEGVRDLVAEYRPAEVAVEDVFMAKDARAAFALGQARGAAIVGASQAGCTVEGYTALQVKKSVTGNGQAAKEQVGFMVQQLLQRTDAITPDHAADAAAVALCHLAKRQLEVEIQ
ncbi:MAG: crossover junction endodeoxyribonuclease RuvC [candidate division Zixibacteria bacterium]|nr:crossover junction endodeoxyribonuclease RuvC [candidate division Zixibacteria bacterium]